MKILISLIINISLSLAGNCQTGFIRDKEIKLFEVFLSNPQPRLNQSSSVVLNPRVLVDTIFGSLNSTDRQNLTPYVSDEIRIAGIQANKIGKYTIGSMQFKFNQTNYYTKELNYEVIDSLPSKEKGLWIRNISINDSLFCLIIEQRIPFTITEKEDNNSSFGTLDMHKQLVVFTPGKYENDLTIMSSRVSSGIKTLTIDGVSKSFLDGETYNFIRVNKRDSKIVLTKNNFINIHEDPNFKNIFIQ